MWKKAGARKFSICIFICLAVGKDKYIFHLDMARSLFVFRPKAPGSFFRGFCFFTKRQGLRAWEKEISADETDT